MLVCDWMSKDPVVITPDAPMMRASKLMKEKNVRRLPVVDEKGKLVGIITDRDVKEASPSKATTLDIHELYYLLSEIHVKEIMTKNPITTTCNNTVEGAALIMREKRIGGLPVIDDHGGLVGIITESDIYKLLIAITGVEHGGLQLGFQIPNEEGELKKILDELKAFSARIVSILTASDGPEAKQRQVYIRIFPMDRSKEDEIVKQMVDKYKLLFWARDNVHPVK